MAAHRPQASSSLRLVSTSVSSIFCCQCFEFAMLSACLVPDLPSLGLYAGSVSLLFLHPQVSLNSQFLRPPLSFLLLPCPYVNVFHFVLPPVVLACNCFLGSINCSWSCVKLDTRGRWQGESGRKKRKVEHQSIHYSQHDLLMVKTIRKHSQSSYQ